jgi:acyl-homoserine lactone synthase
MTHVVTAANADRYSHQIQQMHQLRWRSCIVERRWSALAKKQRREGWEADEYDDDRAVYLLTLDRPGNVQGLVRMRPIEDRSLMFDHFPDLVVDPDQLGDRTGVWELTRLMRAPMARDQDGAVRWESCCAMIEFAISRQVHTLIASCDTFLLPMLRKGWGRNLKPLGLPTAYCEGEQIALALYPSMEMLEAARARAGCALPRLYEHPAGWPPNPIAEKQALDEMRGFHYATATAV